MANKKKDNPMTSMTENGNTDVSNLRNRASELADRFVKEETAFHLGFLPTEKPHPATRDFSFTIAKDTLEGIRCLLAVDGDIPPVAQRIFRSDPYDKLVDAMARAGRNHSKICFSGCGSTGRLAVMLEAMWRQFWEDRAGVEPGVADGSKDNPDPALRMANLVRSIITGGDRALVRSVENFEDFPQFGTRQVAELGLEKGDLLIAMTEGGETPSVLGTLEEALSRDCRVFLVFNNPTELLREHVKRSQHAIDNPKVTVIDLFTGPMALSGSTRMQATTIEILVVGAAVQEASLILANEKPQDRESLAESFATLLGDLNSPENLRIIAQLAERERRAYSSGGLVTYLTPCYLLDLFCDTSERTPTFMLPSFRAWDDHSSPSSWAYAKDPVRSNDQAWRSMLRRSPRGLEWRSADYRAMEAPSSFIDNPPSLGSREIARYTIGSQLDSSRPREAPNWWLQITGADWPLTDLHGVDTLWLEGPAKPEIPTTYRLQVNTGDSPIALWQHILIKLLYNTLSTATMGLMDRIRGNWMVQLNPSNKKLIDRGSRIVAHLAGIDYPSACMELYLSLLSRSPLDPGGEQTTTSPVVAALQRLGSWR